MKNEQQKPDPIINMLDSLKETPERDPERVARSRQQFLSQAAEISRKNVSISWFQRLINVFRMPEPQRRLSTLTISLVLGLLLISFSGSVVAAQSAQPDDILYPYKLWLENQRLALTIDPSNQLELRLEYAEERLDELGHLDEPLSDDDLEDILTNFTNHLTAAETLATENEGDETQLERLQKLLDYSKGDDEMEEEEQEQEEEEQRPSKTVKPSEEPKETPSPEETYTPEGTNHHEETGEPEETDHPNRTEDPDETDTPDEPDETEEPDHTEEPSETQ
jgi:hypothetical protein